MSDNIILGAGIAGISAGYHWKKAGTESVIYEKDNDWGGLCGNFSINGFRFDRFVHFSFAPDESDKKLFAGTHGMYEHVPFPSNYYHGCWLRHPAQNNLAPLSSSEKVDIIADFIARPQKAAQDIARYDEWLRVQYGNYFAEHFPFAYTRKYWGVEASELETKWVGVRMYSPDIRQVLQGSYETQDECFYFAKKMLYPRKGGFRSILNVCREGLDIRLNKKAVHIDVKRREVTFADGSGAGYDRLISTLPLPEIVTMLDNVPQAVREAASGLHHTCGYQVSLGFRRPDVAKYLWFYIYDEDIPPARVYSPNLKSPDNVPDGCSSLQAEVFYDNRSAVPPAEEVLEKTVTSMIDMGLFDKKDIAVCDIRFEPYANITFTPDIYEKRAVVLHYLESIGIKSIGRFGKWDYKWTHQAFADGKEIA